MADRLTGLEMHPHLGILLTGRVRDQSEGVSGPDPVHVVFPFSENDAVDRRTKLRGTPPGQGGWIAGCHGRWIVGAVT